MGPAMDPAVETFTLDSMQHWAFAMSLHSECGSARSATTKLRLTSKVQHTAHGVNGLPRMMHQPRCSRLPLLLVLLPMPPFLGPVFLPRLGIQHSAAGPVLTLIAATLVGTAGGVVAAPLPTLHGWIHQQVEKGLFQLPAHIKVAMTCACTSPACLHIVFHNCNQTAIMNKRISQVVTFRDDQNQPHDLHTNRLTKAVVPLIVRHS
eukprot:scaffold31127_cov18-Tisochrysis_lutea.AAC.1